MAGGADNEGRCAFANELLVEANVAGPVVLRGEGNPAGTDSPATVMSVRAAAGAVTGRGLSTSVDLNMCSRIVDVAGRLCRNLCNQHAEIAVPWNIHLRILCPFQKVTSTERQGFLPAANGAWADMREPGELARYNTPMV